MLLSLAFNRFFPGFDRWWDGWCERLAEYRRIRRSRYRICPRACNLGPLLWYFAPEQDITSKPLASLTLSDLGGSILWVSILIGGCRMLFAMLEGD